MERLRSRRRTPPAKLPIQAQPATAAPPAKLAVADSSELVPVSPALVEAEGVVSQMPANPASGKRSTVKGAVGARRASAQGKAAAAKAGEGAAAKLKSARKNGCKAKTPEFRQVLAKSVESRGSAPPGKTAKIKTGKTERDQRVSVRLSRDEERQLQQCAEQAGVTVSQYLRQCALKDQPARRGKRADLVAQELLMPASQPETAATAKPGGLGEWITLMRNRFLSSPARFAERA
jgi:hypothetical protein